MKKIMIVAGEASGDMHGAKLVEAMRARENLYFCGVGGKELREQGVEVLYESNTIAVVGIFEVFSHLKHIRAALNGLTARLKDDKPDLLILIDFPDFNFILAKRAQKLRIKIFYYISPQVWAWRSGRVKTIARLVDKLAVILPFEKDFYTRHGVKQVEFVGHPLVDTVKTVQPPGSFRKHHNITEKATVVGMLPGSRRKEVSAILPDFLKTAELLRQRRENLCFVLPLASTLDESELNISEALRSELNIKIIREERYDLMAACDLVMVASGTVTLELAILNIPMVVVYRISPLTYFVGRRLIKAKYAALVNLIADREIVKELLQNDFTPGNLSQALDDIWPGTDTNRTMKRQLAKVADSLGGNGASKKAADLALQVIA